MHLIAVVVTGFPWFVPLCREDVPNTSSVCGHTDSITAKMSLTMLFVLQTNREFTECDFGLIIVLRAQ